MTEKKEKFNKKSLLAILIISLIICLNNMELNEKTNQKNQDGKGKHLPENAFFQQFISPQIYNRLPKRFSAASFVLQQAPAFHADA